MKNTKQILVIRKDLNMRKGKMIAQGSHASLAPILNSGTFSNDNSSLTISLKDSNGEFTALGLWITGRFKKITVYVNSESELLELHQKVKDANILCALIQDAGLTEFNGIPTYTALSIGPEFEETLDPHTKHLPLL